MHNVAKQATFFHQLFFYLLGERRQGIGAFD